MKKHKAVAWIVIFLIITASPVFTNFVLGPFLNTTNYEKREKIERPMLTKGNYRTFPQEYEAFYNDNIPFRNQLIRLNNSIDYFLFHRSSNEDVVIGRNGWLFYNKSADQSALSQSLGGWNFSQDQLKKIADNLTKIKDIMESRGIEFPSVRFNPPPLGGQALAAFPSSRNCDKIQH